MKNILTLKSLISAKKILCLGAILIFILSSVTAFAYEFSEDEYNSATSINENEIVEFSFKNIGDVVLFKFNSPYDHATIVVEFLDGTAGYVKKEYVAYRKIGSQLREIYTESHDSAACSGNLKVTKSDKAYVKFSPQGGLSSNVIRFKYKAVPYNIDNWQNAVEIAEGNTSSINFSNDKSDQWIKIHVNSNRLELRYRMNNDTNGWFISDIYSEDDLKNNNISEYMYRIIPIETGGLANIGEIDSAGTYYIHLYPVTINTEAINQNIEFSYLDNGEKLTIKNNENKDTVKTSFGATVSSWAAPEIELAFENNLIPEVMIDYDLTKQVNRGEFAAIALQLYDVLTNSETAVPSSCPFTDINGDINEKAIKKAYSIQITQGMSENTFEPVTFINREQLATMLCRVIKKYSNPDWTMENDDDYYLDTSGVKTFADDMDISAWAKPSVYFMSKFNIVKGIDDTHFAPKNTVSQNEASMAAIATREQAIIIAQRIFKISDMWK